MNKLLLRIGCSLLAAMAILVFVLYWKTIRPYIYPTEITAVEFGAPASSAPTPAAPPRASAASAATAASAPTPVVRATPPPAAASAPVAPAVLAAQVSVAPTSHRTVKGETLGGIAQQYGLDWRLLCIENKKKIKDCHTIPVGAVLDLVISADTVASVKTLPRKYFEPQERIVDCSKTRLGYCVFDRPGGDPVRALSEAAQVTNLSRFLGVSRRVALTWTSAPKELRLMRAGTFVNGLSFGHGYWKGPVLVKQDMWYWEGEVDGRWLAWFEICKNFSGLGPRPEPQQQPEETPKRDTSDPPRVDEGSSPDVPVVDAPPEPAPPEPKDRCLFDPKMVLGQEHEPKEDGNDAHGTYLTAGLYCTWRGEKGTHGVGVGFQGSWFNGHVNSGAGKSGGKTQLFGPAYEYISDDSWNFEGKLLLGRTTETFSQGDYESHRDIDLVAPSIAYNNYARRDRGEKSLPETRLYGLVGWATSVKAKHSWQGKPIADTKELSKFGSLVQLGVHQDLYDFDKLTLWAKAGYFSETPGAESASLRLGIADSLRICGIGAGLDFDLKHGGNVKAWGWGCDGMRGIDVLRAEYRMHQAVKETGVKFDQNDTFMVPMPSPNQ